MNVRPTLVATGGVALALGATAVTGGPAHSPFLPLVYLVVAASAAALPRRIAVFVGAIAIVFGVLGASPGFALAHVGFVLCFGVLANVLLAAEIRAIRTRREAAVEDALERIDQEARDFRLIGAALGAESQIGRSAEALRTQRLAGSVTALGGAFIDVLESARLSVRGDAAMLFLLDGDSEQLRLAECVAPTVDPTVDIDKHARGAIGAVVTTKRPVMVRSKPRGLGYKTSRPVGSFVGVPLIEHGRAVGVLAVDRVESVAFTQEDEMRLEALARTVGRHVDAERIFASMDRAKYEHERFFEALAMLNEALTIESSAERLLESAARLCAGDFNLVVLYDDSERKHRVVATLGDAAAPFAGVTFSDRDGGLIVMAVKNGHALPYVPLSAQVDRPKLELLGDVRLPKLASIKVLPLMMRERAIGAIVVGSTARGHELTLELTKMLETIAQHGATTIANALMFQRVEAMATTDGLTGLVNHRRFKELLAEALSRAERFEHPVSVVMVDADHFKQVNDTYGHPVGDQVLVRIAEVLTAEARKTDVVARYGGEEFVLVLDGTDGPGAVQVAERIRERIAGEQIVGDFGRVRVTASLGVAAWPDAATSMNDLLEEADQALYRAKRAGRDRVELAKGSRCVDLDRPAIPPEAASSPPQVQA